MRTDLIMAAPFFRQPGMSDVAKESWNQYFKCETYNYFFQNYRPCRASKKAMLLVIIGPSGYKPVT